MIARLATRHTMLAFTAVLAVLVIAKPAATQAPAKPPSPNAILLAKQIVEIKGLKALFDPVSRGVVEKAKNAYMQTNFMFAKDIDEITIDLHKEYDARSTELVDAAAQIYATHFTEAELKGLLDFYHSPLGQKMLDQEPKVMDETMSTAAKLADKLSENVMAKMRAEMKKRGHE